ncbi:MAG TPA: aminotransferase class V-fold PLP-dependent enzyme, partial [bacterium]|nr:aminotransferase class V-fold PLP-dependent enzyme [bacterium]
MTAPIAPGDLGIPKAPRPVYLDHNATTPCAPEVVEAMVPFFATLFGNPSSHHRFGGQVAPYLAAAREAVAALVGCEPSEVVF